VVWYYDYYRKEENFGAKNFGEFGKSIVIRQIHQPFRKSRSAMLKASVCGMSFWKHFKHVADFRLFCNSIKGAIVCLGVQHPISIVFMCHKRSIHLQNSDVQPLCTRIHTCTA